MKAYCGEIGAAAETFLQRRVEVFLRMGARSVVQCPPMASAPMIPTPRTPTVPPSPEQLQTFPPAARSRGLCGGDCMLPKEPFRFRGYPDPKFYPHGRPPSRRERSLRPLPDRTVPSGDPLPLVRVEPLYPPRAFLREIEGWVLLEFSVSPAGTVVDPFVVDSEPARTFDGAALSAVRRWKYKPKVENGVAVPRHGVQVVLPFELEAP